MRKIPTLFVRDEQDRRHVTTAISEGCEWVLTPEAVATRKYDGTCCMLDDEGRWWARREVKVGKMQPPDFVTAEYDSVTDRMVGWVPMSSSSFAKWHAVALMDALNGDASLAAGTYELCGPKVNGDPEHFYEHILIRHADATPLRFDGTLIGEDGVYMLIHYCTQEGWEGVVWHHPDGRMCKLKARDFPADFDWSAAAEQATGNPDRDLNEVKT